MAEAVVYFYPIASETWLAFYLGVMRAMPPFRHVCYLDERPEVTRG